MKLPTFFLAIIFARAAYAVPDKTVVDSCLLTEAVTSTIHYTGFRPTNFYREDDDGIVSTTFKYEGHATGTWESLKAKKFGLVYKGRKIRQRDFVRLGPDEPALFDPTLAQWGIVGREISIIFVQHSISKDWGRAVPFKIFVAFILLK